MVIAAIVGGIFVALISLGVMLVSEPKLEVIEASYYAPYGDSNITGECKLTIKNTGSSAAHNVTISIMDQEDKAIKEEVKTTLSGGGTFTIMMSLKRETANRGIKVTISYTYTNPAGKTFQKTERMVVKPKSIIP